MPKRGSPFLRFRVDLRKGEQFTPSFRAINPDCTVPALELDNGTIIPDAIAICRCFEELYPNPPLMGRTAEEKAVIESWQRLIERDAFYAVMEAFRNSSPGLKGRALPGPDNYEQIAALSERGRTRIQHFFARLDAQLVDNEIVCGPRFSIADITALITVDFSGWIKVKPIEVMTQLRRWHAAVSARPSAKARATRDLAP